MMMSQVEAKSPFGKENYVLKTFSENSTQRGFVAPASHKRALLLGLLCFFCIDTGLGADHALCGCDRRHFNFVCRWRFPAHPERSEPVILCSEKWRCGQCFCRGRLAQLFQHSGQLHLEQQSAAIKFSVLWYGRFRRAVQEFYLQPRRFPAERLLFRSQ